MAHSYRNLVPISEQDVQRFTQKIVVNKSGCHEWAAFVCPNGYGRFWYAGYNWSAHRVAFLIGYDINPGNLLVCHTCDNRCCVNPNHLFLGTHLANNLDRDNKGHTCKGPTHHLALMDQRGEKNGRSKLTAEQVVEIRNLRAAGEKWLRLAKRYGLSRQTVKNIVSGKLWAHIDRL